MRSYGNPNGGYTGSTWEYKRVLKRDYKAWYLFNLNHSAQIKPYPVFQGGKPCPVRLHSEVDGTDMSSLTPEQMRDYYTSLLPDAFIRLPIASFIGSGQASFVDLCSDTEAYASRRTPYSIMVNKLLFTLPTDKKPQGDGKVQIPELATLTNRNANRLSRSVNSLLFRGALLKHKDNPVNVKSAVDGTLYTCVFQIPQVSAYNSFVRMFAQPYEPRHATSATNTIVRDLFNYDGSFISFEKDRVTDSNGNKPYLCDVVYDDNVALKMCSHLGADSQEAWDIILERMLEPYPSDIYDMFNIMTCQEMVTMLLEIFDPALVYYGLHDSNFAGLLPPQAKLMAYQNPAIATRLGYSDNSSPNMNIIQSGTKQLIQTPVDLDDVIPGTAYTEYVPKQNTSFQPSSLPPVQEVSLTPPSPPQEVLSAQAPPVVPSTPPTTPVSGEFEVIPPSIPLAEPIPNTEDNVEVTSASDFKAKLAAMKKYKGDPNANI